MGAISFVQCICPCGQCHQQKVFKTITWLLLSRLQGNKPHRNSPEPSEPCYTGTLGNPQEPFGICLRNIHQHAPEPSGTLRNSGTLQNLPFRTCLRNLHRHTPELAGTLRNLPSLPLEPTPATPELSGTFRNLPPESTPAHTGSLRNLPEPSSGTYSWDPHRHTPELIWAEDPISLRCWGKNANQGMSGMYVRWTGTKENDEYVVYGLDQKSEEYYWCSIGIDFRRGALRSTWWNHSPTVEIVDARSKWSGQ